MINYLIILPLNIKKNIKSISLDKLKSHNIKELEHLSSEFLNWLVGFIDAEGTFYIFKNKTKYDFRIEI